jgi:PAS domain S-box-containing protein
MKAKSPRSKDKTKAAVQADSPRQPEGPKPFPVVGVGASAGGYEAFAQFLDSLPPECGMAFVLVQHLDPKHASSLTEPLTRSSRLPIRQVKDGMLVEINHVYVIPPNTDLMIKDNAMHLSPRDEKVGPQMSADHFLPSLADDCKSQAIGVNLSEERDVLDNDGHWHRLTVRPHKSTSNQIEGAVLNAVDIDTIKRNEQVSRESESRLQQILDTVAEGIISLSDNGVVQNFNRAAERIFGYSAAEMAGKHINFLVSKPQRQKTSDISKFVGQRFEVEGQRKDGSLFPLEMHLSEVPDDKGPYTVIVRDLMEAKRAQERLLQSERLASIGQVSAGLAHESRNALQRAQACVEMLRREIKDQKKAEELLDRVQDAQNRLLQLYEETRSFAAPINLNRKLTDLDKVIRTAWDALEEARKRRKAKLTSKPGKLNVQCEVDATQIEQVVRNILENALQACPDPCKIDVTWSETELNGQPAVQMAFRNNGPALSPQEMEHLFDAFFTTKTHGTGLGLTIARRIVEAHGGRLEFNPKLKDGAQILVTLPRGNA